MRSMIRIFCPKSRNLALKMKLLTKMQGFLSVTMMGNILGASTPCQPSDRFSCRIQVSVKEHKRVQSVRNCLKLVLPNMNIKRIGMM
jgi:hypothetical protein